MKKIPLTRGQYALVDDEDFEKLDRFRWCALKCKKGVYYAVRYSSMRLGKQKFIYMHRQIMNPPDDMQIDHRNMDTLDNRKSNLRICTGTENARNSAKRSDNSSGYKGVSWRKDVKKWVVKIRIDGKQIHLGHFTDKVEASRVYDNAAIKYYGEFANLNSV